MVGMTLHDRCLKVSAVSALAILHDRQGSGGGQFLLGFLSERVQDAVS